MIGVEKRNGMSYAGIGSRKTPKDIQKMMIQIGSMYASLGYVLHSGGAEGADTAFATGHGFIAPLNKEIFLPWNNFNQKTIQEQTTTIGVSMEAYAIARKYYIHPNKNKNWNDLKSATKKLMARNAYQILGPTLNKPVDFVVCWTEDGKELGGTSQAIRMANSLKIPVFNLGNKEHLALMNKALRKFHDKCAEAIMDSNI